MAGIRAVIAVAAATIGVLLVAGCSGKAGDAMPTSTASSTPSPSADPLSAVDAILVGGDGLHLRHGSETLTVLDYRDDPTQVLAALTAVLGAPTSTSETEGTNHTVPATLTEFGGLRVYSPHYDEPVTADYLARPAWTVSVTTPTAGSIAVKTSAGLVVGEPFADAKSAVGDYENYLVGADGTRTSRTLVEKVPGSPADAGDAGGVMVVGNPDGGAITSIYAPGTLSAP